MLLLSFLFKFTVFLPGFSTSIRSQKKPKPSMKASQARSRVKIQSRRPTVGQLANQACVAYRPTWPSRARCRPRPRPVYFLVSWSTVDQMGATVYGLLSTVHGFCVTCMICAIDGYARFSIWSDSSKMFSMWFGIDLHDCSMIKADRMVRNYFKVKFMLGKL